MKYFSTQRNPFGTHGAEIMPPYDDVSAAIIVLADGLGDSDSESTTSPETISSFVPIFGDADSGGYFGSAGGRHGWLTDYDADLYAFSKDDVEFDADVSVFIEFRCS